MTKKGKRHMTTRHTEPESTEENLELGAGPKVDGAELAEAQTEPIGEAPPAEPAPEEERRASEHRRRHHHTPDAHERKRAIEQGGFQAEDGAPKPNTRHAPAHEAPPKRRLDRLFVVQEFSEGPFCENAGVVHPGRQLGHYHTREDAEKAARTHKRATNGRVFIHHLDAEEVGLEAPEDAG